MTQEQTRKDLELAGYTFHRGYLNVENDRFIMADMPSDCVPPHLGDLLAAGWIRVPEGILEPPREGGWKQLLGLAAVAGAMWIGFKSFNGTLLGHDQRYFEEVRR